MKINEIINENAAAGITKAFNSLGDPVFANLQRVALLAMQGRQQEAAGRLQTVIKGADPAVQKKITDAVNNIKPVTINGRVADSSTLDKSKQHNDWIINTFIPWVQSLLGQQGIAEGKQPGQPVVDAILKVMPAAQEIWFHGSRATGKHRRNSDTDILVVVPDDLAGDQYLGVVRILQKLSSHFDNYDIQPTKAGTNIHRIAQEEGQLLWSNKQDMAEDESNDTAISLSKLGKFHPGADTLAEFVPERATAQYALHPDKWESTFYSLTNKDSDKLKYYGPKKISIPPGTLVGDMAIANKFYRAKTTEEKQHYAELYKQSLKPYPVDVSEYRMPELLIPKQGVAEGLDDNGISFQVQKGKNKFATTLSVGGDPVGVYQYDANTGRSIAEVYPEFKGKGLGKLLVLHAIYTAANLGLDFQEDESRTSEYDNVLDSLSSNGYIVDDDGYWYVTGEGEQYLKQSMKQGVAENFADGKNPGRKGLSKRVGIPKKATLGKLEKIARSSTGERRRMAQWQLNMRRGKKK
jgi:predicted nucleotidyltransferase/GNAT superfamily N-acetyltransferase